MLGFKTKIKLWLPSLIKTTFRMYENLSGMTGTAKTEEAEFIQIYNLEVVDSSYQCTGIQEY